LTKSLNQYLTALNEALTPGARERLYSDGFVAVLISIFKLLVIHLRKRPSDNDLTIFMEPLSRYLNVLSDEEASQLRKGLTSKAGRTQLRNELVSLLQNAYDKEFAVGLLSKETSLAEEINKLEYQLNKLVNHYLTSRYDSKWIFDQSILRNQDEIRRIREQSARAGTYPWEHLNFMTTLTNFVANKNYWEDFFGQFFKQSGIATPEEALVFGRKLWDYRSNRHGHERSRPVIYTKEEETLVKTAYRMFKRAIEAGNSRFNGEQLLANEDVSTSSDG
jgi:hypothetical protein